MHNAASILGKRTMLAAALALWVAAWAAWTADWLLQPMPFMLERALRRIPVCLAGFALSWALIVPLRRTVRRPFLERLMIAVGLCLAASSVQAVITETAYYVIAPKWGGATWIDVVTQAMTVFWVFAAWVTLYFAIEYDAEAQQTRLRLADAQASALEARNRALMGQVNPHFLFNTLNTVSGLIMAGASEQADRTVLSLARLLRGSLDRHPPPFRALEDEVGVQLDFIDVQRARFGDRFHIVLDVAPDAGPCQVPSLILQPLVENVFTHGVARSEERVTLELRARREGELLIVQIDDDARPAPGALQATTGLGLSNVSQRLDVLYGAAASLEHGNRPTGGYTVAIRLPVRS